MTDTTPDTPSTPDPAPSTVPDGWELHPSRWATLWIDGTAYRLKPPKVGELKKISERAQANTDELNAMVATMRERLDEVRQAVIDGNTELTNADASRLDIELGKEKNERIRDGWWEVMLEIFDLLGDTPLPPEDDLPAWVKEDAGAEIRQIMHHFRSAPPLRGVRR